MQSSQVVVWVLKFLFLLPVAILYYVHEYEQYHISNQVSIEHWVNGLSILVAFRNGEGILISSSHYADASNYKERSSHC